MTLNIPTSFMNGPSESSPGHTGLRKRGPPVVFGSYKGQMLQNNDQQSQGLTRRFVLSAKKTTHLFQMYFSSSSQNLTTNFEFLVVCIWVFQSSNAAKQ